MRVNWAMKIYAEQARDLFTNLLGMAIVKGAPRVAGAGAEEAVQGAWDIFWSVEGITENELGAIGEGGDIQENPAGDLAIQLQQKLKKVTATQVQDMLNDMQNKSIDVGEERLPDMEKGHPDWGEVKRIKGAIILIDTGK